jgi:hypothetical protein
MKQREGTLEVSGKNQRTRYRIRSLTVEAAEFDADIAEKTLIFLRSSAKTSASNDAKPFIKTWKPTTACEDRLSSNYDPIT